MEDFMQISTQFEQSENLVQKLPYRFFVVVGVLIWFLATVVLRLWGHTFFIVENPLSMGGVFLLVLIGLPVFTHQLFQWKKVLPHQRRDAAICLVIPGMLLDVPTTYFFAQVYPNMLPSADGAFGAWLLWGYALVLITGLMTGRPSREIA
jgi:Family of unknown function (DUF5367)